MLTMTNDERLIHNEKVKLRATFVNNLGAAAIAGGVFSLAWQALPQGTMSVNLMLIQLFAFGMGLGSHYVARKLLEELVA